MSFESAVPTTPLEVHTEHDVMAYIPPLLSWTSSSGGGDASVRTTVSKIAGGITNTIFALTNEASGDCVIVRIFGAAQIFSQKSRQEETRIFAQLSDARIAPTLRAVFANGRVEQYVPAAPIPLAAMTDRAVGLGLAHRLARLHAFTPAPDSTPPPDPPVWALLQEWADRCVRETMKGTFSDAEGFASSHVERAVHALPRLRSELRGGLVVYAHNDLLAGNILMGEDGSVTIVDFEYSGWNYSSFDIGNYFAEAMGGTQDAVIRTHLYPDRSFRAMFCAEYLRVLHDSPPTEAAVNWLVEDAERYGLLSHIYWGLWAVVQSIDSTIDFRYRDYARQRLDLFFNKCDCA